MEKEIVKIFDTTLRDGDQGPGGGFTEKEKRIIAYKLRDLGVDVIEAGFAASRVDRAIPQIVEDIGKDFSSPTIASLSRAVRSDIDASYEALLGAKKPRIHTFIATSDAHIESKFQKSGESLEHAKERVLKMIEESVSHSVKTGFEVQWSAEDATNSDKNFLLGSVCVAIESGAKIINIPDTLGVATTWEIEELFSFLIKNTEDLKKEGFEFEFSTHNHNDLSNAAVNTVSAVKGGARQIETTILGLGERAGNAALHRVVGMIDKWDKKLVSGKIVDFQNLNRGKIYEVSKIISEISLRRIEAHEPVIGTHAAKDGSGIHNDGNLKSKSKAKPIYTPVETEIYGTSAAKSEFYARGGSAEIVEILKSYGIETNKKDPVISEVTKKAASKAQEAKVIHSANVYAIYLEEIGQFEISEIKITDSSVSASFNLFGKEIKIYGEAEGENGTINATVKGINSVLGRLAVKVNHVALSEKASVNKIIKDYEVGLPNLKNGGSEKGSEQIGIAGVELDVDGEIVRVRSSGHNVDKEFVRAILIGSVKSFTQNKMF